eukprot:5563770-Ditylum_brightwellii.AAC.1
MVTCTASRTKSPGCGAPNENLEEILSNSPVIVTPCHKPTGLPTPKPPTKLPNLLFQVNIPSALPLQMNP